MRFVSVLSPRVSGKQNLGPVIKCLLYLADLVNTVYASFTGCWKKLLVLKQCVKRHVVGDRGSGSFRYIRLIYF